MFRPALYAVILGLAFAAALAQVSTSKSGTLLGGESGSGLATVADQLRELHVPLTTQSLVSALSSENWKIRGLAAAQLAVEKATDATPFLFTALQVESVPIIRVGMAQALASLGDKRGIEFLHRDCIDDTVPIHVRLQAANYLENLNGGSCSEALVQALKSDSSGDRSVALSLIPNFKHLSAAESSEVQSILLASLSDPDTAVKVAAANTLWELDYRAGIPALQAAIAKESNSSVLNTLQYALKRLQGESQSSLSPPAGREKVTIERSSVQDLGGGDVLFLYARVDKESVELRCAVSLSDCAALQAGEYELVRLGPGPDSHHACVVVGVYRLGGDRSNEKPLGEYCLFDTGDQGANAAPTSVTAGQTPHHQ